MKPCAILLLLALIPVGGVWAAPITETAARQTTETFVRANYPITRGAAVKRIGDTPRRIDRIEVLSAGGGTIGFISHLDPGGFVLLRADDRLAPLKLHSDTDRFSDLPPAFRRLVGLELEREYEALQALARKPGNRVEQYEWIIGCHLATQHPGKSAVLTGAGFAVKTELTRFVGVVGSSWKYHGDIL